MSTFIVTGSYQTDSGNMATFRFEIAAEDHAAAMTAAKIKIISDGRRKYAGKLDMSCS